MITYSRKKIVARNFEIFVRDTARSSSSHQAVSRLAPALLTENRASSTLGLELPGSVD